MAARNNLGHQCDRPLCHLRCHVHALLSLHVLEVAGKLAILLAPARTFGLKDMLT